MEFIDEKTPAQIKAIEAEPKKRMTGALDGRKYYLPKPDSDAHHEKANPDRAPTAEEKADAVEKIKAKTRAMAEAAVFKKLVDAEVAKMSDDSGLVSGKKKKRTLDALVALSDARTQ